MRARLRDLGIIIGDYPTGPYNAITDVPDVLVGHSTLIYDKPRIAFAVVAERVEGHGGDIAGPIIAKIMDVYFGKEE